MRNSAKRRCIPFLLQIDQFVVWLKEQKVDTSPRENKATDWTVDRIDVMRGYELGNLQIITRRENAFKWNYLDRFHNQPNLLPVAGEQPF